MKWKHLLFSLTAILLFFGIAELILWAAGVRTLVSERDPFQGFSEQVRVFQLDSARGVYFTPPRAVLHSFNYQQFQAQKPANGFRVFVLGGSSAYGFPWGAPVAFPRFLGDALQASWPDRAVEAVNAAGMSYGSHRLRILAGEVLGYRPDLLIVYEGHNEFVERRFYRDYLTRPSELDRFELLLGRSRLYSAMTRLYETLSRPKPSKDRDAGAGGKTAAELLGIDVIREHSTNVTDAEKAEVRRLFEDNVGAILDMARKAGVPVLLCTVPSNLSGWKPNQSAFAPEVSFENRRAVQDLLGTAKAALDGGNAAAAVQDLEKARSFAVGYAEVQFLLGRAYEALGRWDDARRAYALARDADAKPTRAVSGINEAIRRLARQPGAILVDVERDLEPRAPHGLLGFDLFQDYVHPKPETHQLIALELWKAIRQRGLVSGSAEPADEAAFWKALGNENGQPSAVRLDRYLSDSQGKAPALLYNLAVVLENQGLADEAIEKYRECRDLGPSHFVEATCSIGRLLHQKERFAEAADEYHKALDADPGHVKSLLGLAEALRRLNRPDEAIDAFVRATRADPGHAPAWDRLGVTLSERGRQPEAEAAFRRAVELDGGNADFATDLGFVLLFQNKIREAEAVFRKALALRPDQIRARNGLAAALTETGALDEAEAIFRENLRIHPGDSGAKSGLAILEHRRQTGR